MSRRNGYPLRLHGLVIGVAIGAAWIMGCATPTPAPAPTPALPVAAPEVPRTPPSEETPHRESVPLGSHLQKQELDDLDRIIKNRYLRILTTKNPYEYFVSRGQAKGPQYEMASEFAKYLNHKFNPHGKIRISFEVIPVDFDQLIPMLNAG